MSADALLLRQSLVVVSALIYWAGVAVNARRLRRQLGRNPNVKPRGWKERLLWLGWVLVVIAWAGQPFLISVQRTSPALALPGNLLTPLGFGLGLLLIAVGQAGTYWCYSALGQSWRIWIDRSEQTAMVIHGPYRLVRHPIYSFQIFLLVGMTCLIPTPLSLLIVTAHFILVIVKSRDEEIHMGRLHGEGYRRYLTRTGMFLPKLGTLRRLISGRD